MSGGTTSAIERQRALWRISAALADARAEDHDAAIDAALAKVGRVLDVGGVGVWNSDLVGRTSVQTHVWIAEGGPEDIRDPEVRELRDGVAEQMFANEGIAIFPVTQLAGDRPVAEGWEDGAGLLALIDFVGDGAQTVGVINRRSEFAPEEIEFIQGFATIVRQYSARIRIERDLQHRLDLEAFVVRCVAAVGAVSAHTIDAVVADVLADVVERFDLKSASIYRIGAERVRLQSHFGDLQTDEVGLLDRPAERPFDMPDASVTTLPLYTVANVFLGAAQDLVEEGDTTEVTFLPSGIGDGTREAVVLVHEHRVWDAGELEAARLIAPAIIQNRIRVQAEGQSEYRQAVQAEFAAVAADFLRVERDDVDTVIRDGLQRVCSRLGATVGVMYAIDGEIEGTGRADVVWADGPLPYQVGENVPHLRTNMVEVLKRGEPFAAVLPTTGLLSSMYPLLEDGGDTWTTVTAPLIGAAEPSAVAICLPGDHTEEIELLVDLLSAFADLLAQLRLRLELERSLEREAEAQALLRRCAAILTRFDDFDDAVVEVLAETAEFFDLAELVSWQVDHAGRRYVVRHSVGAFDDVGTPLEFGVDPVMDIAREDAAPCCVDEEVGSETVTSFAVARGTGRLQAVLAATKGGSGLESVGCRTLDELSRLLERMEERVANERYSRNAFGAAPIGIVLCDRDWKIITVNPAFASFAGEDASELVDARLTDLFDVEGDAFPIGAEEIAMVAATGTRVWVRSHATAVEGVSTDDPLWLVHAEDITAQRRADQLLRFQATHDELTGLANRRMLLDAIHEEIDAGESPAVLILDLDRFKNVNDTLGHDRGDELLVAVSDRLRLTVRPGDMVARLGGDEFAILLRGPDSGSDAGFVAQRLLGLLSEPVNLGGQTVFPSASIGIAIGAPTMTVEEIVRQADTAMYRAKAEGRNRHATFDEVMRDQVAERLEVESGLRHALRRQEFEVHYQPEVSLIDGSVLGAEALIRWRHPQHGLLAAAAFVGVAEETGIITEIGEYVLFEACREAAGWGNTDAMIRVNFAAAQLQQPETVDIVREALEETGLAAHRLCVEITESAVMTDVHLAESVLHRLKYLGVHLAVDDFGTGFSSLAYLKRFPVDALKIDRAFVDGLEDHDSDDAFVRSIISLADALGLEVVAEGVESRAQADALVRLGCVRAQGYYFGRPAPPAEIRDRLTVRR